MTEDKLASKIVQGWCESWYCTNIPPPFQSLSSRFRPRLGIVIYSTCLEWLEGGGGEGEERGLSVGSWTWWK